MTILGFHLKAFKQFMDGPWTKKNASPEKLAASSADKTSTQLLNIGCCHQRFTGLDLHNLDLTDLLISVQSEVECIWK